MAPHVHPPRANRPAGKGLHTLAGLFLFLCLYSWSGLSTTPALRADAPDAPDALRFRVQQITSGPNHHWFGYIGQSLTIPWSEDGRFILALEAAFHDRMPGSDDAARVVLIDTRQDNRLLPMDETRAWNFQQGTMFYWRPGADGNQFFFSTIETRPTALCSRSFTTRPGSGGCGSTDLPKRRSATAACPRQVTPFWRSITTSLPVGSSGASALRSFFQSGGRHCSVPRREVVREQLVVRQHKPICGAELDRRAFRLDATARPRRLPR